MRKIYVAVAGMAVLLANSPAFARGLGEAAEAEAARMHARAGGPTNYRDAELLFRYGCRASTDSAYCYENEQRRRGHGRSHNHRKHHRG